MHPYSPILQTLMKPIRLLNIQLEVHGLGATWFCKDAFRKMNGASKDICIEMEALVRTSALK